MPAPRRHPAESAPSKIRCPYCLWLLFGLVACVAWPGLALGATLFGPVWLVLLVVPFLSALLRRIVLIVGAPSGANAGCRMVASRLKLLQHVPGR